jgi:hypothetical protein
MNPSLIVLLLSVVPDAFAISAPLPRYLINRYNPLKLPRRHRQFASLDKAENHACQWGTGAKYFQRCLYWKNNKVSRDFARPMGAAL